MRTGWPLILLACAPAPSDDGAGRPAPGNDVPSDAHDTGDGPPLSPADTTSAVDTSSTGLPTGTPFDTAAPRTGLVRFVALGDGGEGNPDQYAVAEAVGTICAQRGCDFALYLGDNFYDGGVYSVDDEQFQTKFELPYADLDFPFWVVLGNHDFGEVPLEFWRTDFQVEYALRSAKWSMPDHFYAFEEGHAQFVGLDTNMIMLGLDRGRNQRGWARNTLDASDATWKIAFGHHPWKSNGRHGNAGNYEGARWLDPTGVVSGEQLANFFRGSLCGRVDVYIDGHDHNRQWIRPACPNTHNIVSGAAAKTTDFEHRDDNDTVFENDRIEGFVWIELHDRQATIAFYDKDATLEHEGVVTK